jgi:hypothetical protein
MKILSVIRGALLKMTTKHLYTKPTSEKLLIWQVLEGPYLRDEFDEDDLHEGGIPIGLDAMLVVMVEEDGVINTVNFWYDTEEDALEVVKYFKVNIGPLEVK